MAPMKPVAHVEVHTAHLSNQSDGHECLLASRSPLAAFIQAPGRRGARRSKPSTSPPVLTCGGTRETWTRSLDNFSVLFTPLPPSRAGSFLAAAVDGDELSRPRELLARGQGERDLPQQPRERYA